MEVGLRVVRGPDWTLDDSESDGGEGFVGTVVEVGGKSSNLPENLVWVQWDSGIRRDHRAGYHGAYDLHVLDNASSGVNHAGMSCTTCQQTPILGMRWHCLDCLECNLCTTCYMNDEHKKEHIFERFDTPHFFKGIKVGNRIRATRVQAKGIFRGARVKRGPNWAHSYGCQDGGAGKEGLVKEIVAWKKVPRSGVLVSWDEADKNKYRLCYKGKVDVICTSPAVGLCYYKDHLPKLGETQKTKRYEAYCSVSEKSKPDRHEDQDRYEEQHHNHIKLTKKERRVNQGRKRGMNHQSETENTFYQQRSETVINGAAQEKLSNLVLGDKVKVDLPLEMVKEVTDKEVGWDDRMANYVGKVGLLSKCSSQDVTISFDDGENWNFPKCLVSKNEPTPVHEAVPDSTIDMNRTSLDTESEFKCKDVGKVANSDSEMLECRGQEVFKNQSFCEQRSETVINGAAQEELSDLVLGDKVKVDLPLEMVKEVTEQKVGWDDRMANYLGKVGLLSKYSSHDVTISFDDGNNWNFPKCLVSKAQEDGTRDKKACDTRPKLDGIRFKCGDVVRLKDNEHSAKQLQGSHCSISPPREGVVGLVVNVKADGDVEVLFEEECSTVPFNPAALALEAQNEASQVKNAHVENLVTESRQPVGVIDLTFEMMEKLRRILQPLEVQQRDHVHLLFYAVVTNCVQKVKEILDVLPDQVNCQLEGRTPLHIASYDGSFELVQLLLDYGADVNAEDNSGFRPLHYSMFGDRRGKTARILVSCGSDVNSKDNTHHTTPASIAVLRNNEVGLRRLLEGHSDLNLQDRFGDTPLHDAVKTGNVSLATLLLKTPDINRLLNNNEGLNPFLIAVKCGNEALVRTFTQEAPEVLDIPAEDGSRMNALHLACLQKHSAIADILINTKLVDIRAMDSGNKTPLDFAIQNNMHTVVRHLQIANDAEQCNSTKLRDRSLFDDRGTSSPQTTTVLQLNDANSGSRGSVLGKVEVLGKGTRRLDPFNPASLTVVNREHRSSRPKEKSGKQATAISEQNKAHPGRELLKATLVGHLSRVKELVEGDPDVVHYRPCHLTALHLACQSGFPEIIKFLIQCGANKEMQEDCGLTPLHAAAINDKSGKAARTLLEFGVDLNAAAIPEGFTAIHLAVLRDNEATARLLIHGGCDTNLMDSEGNMPLHHAITHGKNNLVDVLVEESSCRRFIQNKTGFSPIHLAARSGNLHATEILLEKYPHCVSETNGEGLTPLHLAVSSGNINVVKAIIGKENVEIDLRDNSNKTALALAVGVNDEIADLLVKKGASFGLL